jgi:ADP-heptose:LPS heptosyltransferase
VKDEAHYIQEKILAHAPHIQNAIGQFDLAQYISFIHACDALIAASTGPLHIAAALEKHAIGLYPPERPINPERWGPIGKKSVYFKGNGDYMEGIGPEIIATYLDQTWKSNT